MCVLKSQVQHRNVRTLICVRDGPLTQRYVTPSLVHPFLTNDRCVTTGSSLGVT